MYVAREQRYCHRKGHCQRVTKIGAMETITSDGYLSHVRTSSGSGNRTISIRSHRLISAYRKYQIGVRIDFLPLHKPFNLRRHRVRKSAKRGIKKHTICAGRKNDHYTKRVL